MPFNIRKKKNMKGKQKIAELIGGMVHDGDHIILDPSTTAVSIVKTLKDRKRLTIITNSIEVLVELTDVNGWEVISTGGTLKENYLALVGARAMQGIASFHADKGMQTSCFRRSNRRCCVPRHRGFWLSITPSLTRWHSPRSVIFQTLT